MNRPPVVGFPEIEKVLLRLGFQRVRQKGSHFSTPTPTVETTTVPNHPGRDIARPLLREILREIELTPEEFRGARDQI